MSMRVTKPAVFFARQLCLVCVLGVLVLALPACVKKGGKGAEPVNPNERQLAYGTSIIIPADWTILGSIPPEAVPKATLDARRKNGQPIPLIEADGVPSKNRGIQPFITIALVNEEGTFVPRQYAEKLKPEELEHMAKGVLERERSISKKSKGAARRNKLLDVSITRDVIGGKLTLMQRMTVVGPDGQPVRLLYWDIYLPDGAGFKVRAGCDQETPGEETAVMNVVKSIRVR